MLTIGIEYLTGYAVATDAADRDRPEWPPHPARVFMAMAAAYFETGADPAERAALEWFERLGDPAQLLAADADERLAVTHYVPVNDELSPGGGPPVLRRRQPRGFPRVRPWDPHVYMHWPAAEPGDGLAVLDRLCAKVGRIGHSSSLVRMWAFAHAPPDNGPPAWVPAGDDQGGGQALRVTTGGFLDDLAARYRADEQAEFDRLTEATATGTKKDRAAAKKQLREVFSDLRPLPVRPEVRIVRGYRRADTGPVPPHSVWDPRLIVRRLERIDGRHPRLDVRAGLYLSQVMHRAAIRIAEQLGLSPVPEALSGHRPDGSPSDRPHLACLALADVGHPHADGHLLGVGFALPRMADDALRARLARVVGAIDDLTLGDLGRWALRSPDPYGPGRLTGLRPDTWCAGEGGAIEWATVTPIVFDEHPKAKDQAEYLAEVADMVKRGCVRVGLPEPVAVVLSHVGVLAGTPAARDFPRLRRKDGSRRRHLHARIVFDQEVRGPVLLGAGRYRGYGLLRPVRPGTQP